MVKAIDMGKKTISAPSGPVRTILLSIRSHSSAWFSEFAPFGGIWGIYTRVR